MSRRAIYIAGSIIGTLSAIIAGGLRVPELVTGIHDLGFINTLLLLVIMSTCVSLFVFLNQRTTEHRELIRIIIIANMWSLLSLIIAWLIFMLIFTIAWNM